MKILSRLWPAIRDFFADNAAAGVVLAVFVVLTTFVNLTDPLFEAPDEYLHYDLARSIQLQGGLPVVDPDGPKTERHQAPLYYALVAVTTPTLSQSELDAVTIQNPFWGYQVRLVGRDNKNQFLHDPAASLFRQPYFTFHLIRFYATLFSAGTVLLTYLIARRFVGRWLALASMSVAAFTPNFLLTASSINNDALSIFMAALGACWLLRIVSADQPPGIGTWIGYSVLLGLGSLVKINVWPLTALSAVAVGLLAWRFRSWRLFFTAGLILFTGWALIAGWWIVRNWQLYGELTGMGVMWQVWGSRHGLPLSDALEQIGKMTKTYWAAFGYSNIRVPGWIYGITNTFMIGGTLGLIVRGVQALRRGEFKQMSTPDRHQLIVLALWAAPTLGGLCWYLRKTWNVTGRQVYAIMPLLTLGWVVGWWTLVELTLNHRQLLSQLHTPTATNSASPEVEQIPPLHAWRGGQGVRLKPAFALVLSALMLVYAVGTWTGVGMAAYSRDPRVKAAALDALSPRLDWTYGESIRLAGYTVSDTEVTVGDTLDVTLYWEVLKAPAMNYTLYVSLVDGLTDVVAQRDTYPGLGNDPTLYWQPGEIIADTVHVPVEQASGGPVLLDVVVGLYDLTSSSRLPVESPAGHAISYPAVGQVKLAPTGESVSGPAVPVEAAFEGGVRLRGYDLGGDRSPGGEAALTLYWAASGPLPADYTVFVHVYDPADEPNTLAQGDGPPHAGRYPTGWWAAGETIVDAHTIPLPADLPPGTYHIRVGFYDPATGIRLALAGGAGDQVVFENALTVE